MLAICSGQSTWNYIWLLRRQRHNLCLNTVYFQVHTHLKLSCRDLTKTSQNNDPNQRSPNVSLSQYTAMSAHHAKQESRSSLQMSKIYSGSKKVKSVSTNGSIKTLTY